MKTDEIWDLSLHMSNISARKGGILYCVYFKLEYKIEKDIKLA